mmetsp:Transcript_17344/g.31353  ORF Transcript_17344/g.31353 Transcript_17344/m.31353 type:complete len:125 (-) Transcript_17344:107-481(-)
MSQIFGEWNDVGAEARAKTSKAPIRKEHNAEVQKSRIVSLKPRRATQKREQSQCCTRERNKILVFSERVLVLRRTIWLRVFLRQTRLQSKSLSAISFLFLWFLIDTAVCAPSFVDNLSNKMRQI